MPENSITGKNWNYEQQHRQQQPIPFGLLCNSGLRDCDGGNINRFNLYDMKRLYVLIIIIILLLAFLFSL